jgi:hypothetical protein
MHGNMNVKYVPVLYTQWKIFEVNIVGKTRKLCSRWEADSGRPHRSPSLYSLTLLARTVNLHFTIKQFEATSGVTTFLHTACRVLETAASRHTSKNIFRVSVKVG